MATEKILIEVEVLEGHVIAGVDIRHLATVFSYRTNKWRIIDQPAQPAGEAVAWHFTFNNGTETIVTSESKAEEIRRYLEVDETETPLYTHPAPAPQSRQAPDCPYGYTAVENSNLARLKEIEHRCWHIFDEMCDDGSDELKIDKQVSEIDLGILHDLLPEDHPDTGEEVSSHNAALAVPDHVLAIAVKLKGGAYKVMDSGYKGITVNINDLITLCDALLTTPQPKEPS